MSDDNLYMFQFAVSVMKCNPNVIEIHIVSYKMQNFVNLNKNQFELVAKMWIQLVVMIPCGELHC